MRRKSKVACLRTALFLILGFITFNCMPFKEVSFLSSGGIVYAQTPERQKNEENSATETAPAQEAAVNGMEALSDLATTQPVTKEFLRTLETRRKDLEVREKAVGQQEQELLLLRQDIEAKLARLEKMRTELEKMTQEVDKSRKKDLAKAVQVYSAMEPTQSAKIFNQMDLETVVAVLKEMDVETAGGILDAMAADPGTDSARMEKLKAIGESMVDSRKLKKPAVSK